MLFNGALFVERRNPQRALCLLAHAKSMSSGRDDHGRYLDAIALMYAAAIMPRLMLNGIAMSSTVANALRSEIQTSADPALLSKVGTDLVKFEQDQTGLSLIERAIQLNPNNSQWQESLESAEAEPVRRANLEAIYRELRQR